MAAPQLGVHHIGQQGITSIGDVSRGFAKELSSAVGRAQTTTQDQAKETAVNASTAMSRFIGASEPNLGAERKTIQTGIGAASLDFIKQNFQSLETQPSGFQLPMYSNVPGLRTVYVNDQATTPDADTNITLADKMVLNPLAYATARGSLNLQMLKSIDLRQGLPLFHEQVDSRQEVIPLHDHVRSISDVAYMLRINHELFQTIDDFKAKWVLIGAMLELANQGNDQFGPMVVLQNVYMGSVQVYNLWADSKVPVKNGSHLWFLFNKRTNGREEVEKAEHLAGQLPAAPTFAECMEKKLRQQSASLDEREQRKILSAFRYFRPEPYHQMEPGPPPKSLFNQPKFEDDGCAIYFGRCIRAEPYSIGDEYRQRYATTIQRILYGKIQVDDQTLVPYQNALDSLPLITVDRAPVT